MKYSVENIAANLESRMVEQKGFKAKLAEKCYIEKSSINKYLSGVRVPTSDVLCRLAHALGVTPNDLLAERK